MAKRKRPGWELERAERAAPVIALRREGLSFREIADRTGISKSACHRRYATALALLPPIKDLEEHRREAFVDVQLTIDALRHLAHGVDGPPRQRDVGHFLAAIEKEMRLIGLDGPRPEADQWGRTDSRPSTNGLAHPVPYDRSVWARVMAYPRDDDDPVDPLVMGDDSRHR